MSQEKIQDLQLIKSGFPCHQVGAETQRERGASSALPPLYFLHVWWARRPRTPSRAAILASLLPADYDPDQFLMDLGIERVQVNVNGIWWTITDNQLSRLEPAKDGREVFRVDSWTLKWLEKENKQRDEVRSMLNQAAGRQDIAVEDDLLSYWHGELQAIPEPFPKEGSALDVRKAPARPAEFNALMEIGKAMQRRTPNLYGYDRAYKAPPPVLQKSLVILDPTAGGGSIPFEALRAGHRVIANELNPVAATILEATLRFPARYGMGLTKEIEGYGSRLLAAAGDRLAPVFPVHQPLPKFELNWLQNVLSEYPDLVTQFADEETTSFIFARQVTCPNCGGEAPLLNSCWLSKQPSDQWGVRIVPDGRRRGGTVSFETYRAVQAKGPNGEDPNFATVSRGVGTCIHCKQAISAGEIKRQARRPVAPRDMDRSSLRSRGRAVPTHA